MPKPGDQELRLPDPGLVVNCPLRGRNRVEFLQHALAQMTERGISPTQVIEAIDKPDQTGLPVDQSSEPDAPPRLRFRKLLGQSLAMDVVFEEEPDLIRVVTAWFRRPRLSGRF